MDGARYLAASARGEPPPLERRVLVVGGGSAAIDVARSARRAGHAVTLLALEREKQMPAQRDEVVEALEEGITLVDGAMLRSVSRRHALTCTASASIPARVPSAAASSCGRCKAASSRWRWTRCSAPSARIRASMTSGRRCAAAGRCCGWTRRARPAMRASGPAATWQIAWRASSPKRWAWASAPHAIDRRLRERAGVGPAADAAPSSEPVVPLSAISLHYHPQQARAASSRRPAAERMADQDEVQLGLDVAKALAEAQRCFSCGSCIHCDQCVIYCPDWRCSASARATA